MLNFLRLSGLRRRWLAAKAPAGPMRGYYATPFPSLGDDWRQAEYAALDLETTGLSANAHEIVSIGWVVIREGRIQLGESGHQLVKTMAALTPESATIHKIFDTHLEDAPPLEEVLAHLLPVLAGRVLLAHHSRIERSFLDAACRRCFGFPFEIVTVDTLELERRTLTRRHQPIKSGDLRLDACRQRYNLPRYRAHNALLDAVAAAELFLAQADHRSAGKSLSLRHFAL